MSGGGPMLGQNVSYQKLQQVMDGVLRDLYHIPVHLRTTAKVLEFIHRRQKEMKSENLFSNGCDYIVLAQVIDHFLQEVMTHQDPYAWFCDIWEAFDEEKERLFTLRHVVIRKEEKHVSFRKFFVDCHEESVQKYYHGAIFCSKHMFSQEPSLIEYVNLTTGEKKVLWAA